MPNVAYIIHKHSHVLYFSERCRNDFENLPIVAYHHPNNLSDTFVRAQLPETILITVTMTGALPVLFGAAVNAPSALIAGFQCHAIQNRSK